MEVLGIDIGGSGIKGAVVDVDQGALTTERRKILTPQPASPEAMAGVVAELVDFFSWDGPVGCTFPGVVRKGTVLSAANVDAGWVGVHGGELFAEAIGRSVVLLNDADAAGIAEFRFGVAGREGVVFVLTFGTGIGSAVFVEGHLMPNTEFGHIEFKGMDAEHYCAARVREAEGTHHETVGAAGGPLLELSQRAFRAGSDRHRGRGEPSLRRVLRVARHRGPRWSLPGCATRPG